MRSQGQKALSEYQSKELLSSYGIPITKEALARSADEAAAIAADIKTTKTAICERKEAFLRPRTLDFARL